MIKARYKCGYCDHIFALAYFNSQDIPERNIGCPNCRVAGEKVILIKKIRDERNIKKPQILLYPIMVLEAERDNIHGLPKNRAAQLQRAIDILIGEKYKIVKQEFKREEKKRKKDKRLGKKNFYDL